MRLLILIDSHTLALHESSLSSLELVQAVHAGDPCLHLPHSKYGWQALQLQDLVIALPAAEMQPAPKLTPQQAQVLDCLLEGLNTHQIALRLNVADQTARRYIRQVKERLGVASREEAILKRLVPGQYLRCGDE